MTLISSLLAGFISGLPLTEKAVKVETHLTLTSSDLCLGFPALRGRSGIPRLNAVKISNLTSTHCDSHLSRFIYVWVSQKTEWVREVQDSQSARSQSQSRSGKSAVLGEAQGCCDLFVFLEQITSSFDVYLKDNVNVTTLWLSRPHLSTFMSGIPFYLKMNTVMPESQRRRLELDRL